jgi:hypothetical protein
MHACDKHSSLFVIDTPEYKLVTILTYLIDE